MPSTYSPNLLEMQGFNENSNSWGLRDNTNFNKIDSMINGWLVKDLSSQAGVYILTALQGQLDEQANSGMQFTGLLTANIALRIPSVAQQHVIWNNTSGGFTLNVSTTSGTVYPVPPGRIAWIRCDGVNSFDNINYINGAFTINGTFTAGTLSSSGALTGTSLSISGASTLSGNVTCGGAMAATGNINSSASIGATLDIIASRNIAATGTLTIGGTAAMSSSLQVNGVLNSSVSLNWAGNTVGTNAVGTRFVSTGGPSGGANNDLWFQII